MQQLGSSAAGSRRAVRDTISPEAENPRFDSLVGDRLSRSGSYRSLDPFVGRVLLCRPAAPPGPKDPAYVPLHSQPSTNARLRSPNPAWPRAEQL